ncbi:WD40-repeat-containing domain protein [Mycena rebaudengoi]|nr:WD40-repeat-containing domain protein [Mycena rebaudengoi]
MLAPRSSPSENQYAAPIKLRGHTGAIINLKTSDDGRFLASAGADGTKIWDLSTMRELRTPKFQPQCGASTALVWIKREDDLAEGLIYGSQHGQLTCLKEEKEDKLAVFEQFQIVRVVKPAEITSLAFDALSGRLAVCHREGIVQVYTLEGNMSLSSVFTIELKDVVPRAMAFGYMNANTNERDLLVFGLYGGDIHILRGPNGDVVERRYVGARIGDVAINIRTNTLCMDDPSSGANLYALKQNSEDLARKQPMELTRKKTFSIPVTKPAPRVRQVALTDDCKTIVSGSDHGVVYVFDRTHETPAAVLRVKDAEWVQTVAVAECAGFTTIFAAKSDNTHGTNDIHIFRRKIKTARLGGLSTLCGLLIFLQLFVLGVAMMFVYKNVEYNQIDHSVGRSTPAELLDVLHLQRSLALAHGAIGRSTPIDPEPAPVIGGPPSGLAPPLSPLPRLLAHFLGFLPLCPACGSPAATPPPAPAPPPPHARATSFGLQQAPVGPMNERVLPQLPIQFLFTLFLLETQFTGDWRHLVIPYTLCLVLFLIL